MLPGLALAIALMCVVRFRGRVLLRVPGVLALGAPVGVFLSQSLPPRTHDEWQRSFSLTDRMAAVSARDKDPTYLWQAQPDHCPAASLFATSVWLQKEILSSLLPMDTTLTRTRRSGRT